MLDIYLKFMLVVTPILFPTILTFYGFVVSKPDSDNFQALKSRLRNESQLSIVALAQSRVKLCLSAADRFFQQSPTVGPYKRRYWTARTFDRCLLLAVIYPFFSLMLGWILFGKAGDLGEALGFQLNESLVFRLLLTLGLIGSIWFGFKFIVCEGWKSLIFLIITVFIFIGTTRGLPRIFPNESVPLAYTFAFAGAGGTAFALSSGLAFPGTVALSGAAAVIPIVTNPLVALIGCLTAASVAVLAALQRQVKWLPISLVILLIIYGGLCFAIPMSGVLPDRASSVMPLLMGLTLIPLLNLPFDWFSIGLTRKCLRRSLSATTSKARLGWAALDFSLAVLAMIGLCLTMIIGLEAFNAAAHMGGHEYVPAPVARQIQSISTNPLDPNHFWIYFALFTTLLPTVIHAFIWLFSLCGLPFVWDRKIGHLATDKALSEGGAAQGWIAIAVSLQWTLAFAILSFLILVGIPGLLAGTPFLGEGFLWLMETTQEQSAAFFS